MSNRCNADLLTDKLHTVLQATASMQGKLHVDSYRPDFLEYYDADSWVPNPPTLEHYLLGHYNEYQREKRQEQMQHQVHSIVHSSPTTAGSPQSGSGGSLSTSVQINTSALAEPLRSSPYVDIDNVTPQRTPQAPPADIRPGDMPLAQQTVGAGFLNTVVNMLGGSSEQQNQHIGQLNQYGGMQANSAGSSPARLGIHSSSGQFARAGGNFEHETSFGGSPTLQFAAAQASANITEGFNKLLEQIPAPTVSQRELDGNITRVQENLAGFKKNLQYLGLKLDFHHSEALRNTNGMPAADLLRMEREEKNDPSALTLATTNEPTSAAGGSSDLRFSTTQPQTYSNFEPIFGIRAMETMECTDLKGRASRTNSPSSLSKTSNSGLSTGSLSNVRRTFIVGDDIGWIREFFLESGKSTGRELEVGGRIIGIASAFDDSGRTGNGLTKKSRERVYCCDASRGLLEVNLNTKEVKQIVSTVADQPLGCPFGITVSRVSGRVFFTDMTDISPWTIYRKYPRPRYAGQGDELAWRSLGRVELEDAIGDRGAIHRTYATEEAFHMDFLRNKPTGRVVVFDPRNKKADVLCENLYCPTGICVVESETDPGFLLIAESTRTRIRRIDLATGASSVFASDLPGIPESLTVVDSAEHTAAKANSRNTGSALFGAGSSPFGGARNSGGSSSGFKPGGIGGGGGLSLSPYSPGGRTQAFEDARTPLKGDARKPHETVFLDDNQIWIGISNMFQASGQGVLDSATLYQLPSMFRKMVNYAPKRFIGHTMLSPQVRSLAIKLSCKNGDLVEFYHDDRGASLGKISTVVETTDESGSRLLLFAGHNNSCVAKLNFNLNEKIRSHLGGQKLEQEA